MATSKLQDALRAVSRSVAVIAKDAENAHFKYKYCSAEAVCTRVNAALCEHGIAIVGSTAEVLHYDPVSIVRLSWTLALDFETATFQGLGSGTDKGDKAIMKANTAALKYLLGAAFCISWGDDPEADAATDARAEPKAPPYVNILSAAAAMFDSIGAAGTHVELRSLRDGVISFRGEDCYDDLVREYKNKEKELENVGE